MPVLNSQIPPRMEPASDRRRRVLAVASGGGHWVQLSRIFPALQAADVALVTTIDGYQGEIASSLPGSRLYTVTDASRETPFRLLRLVWQITAVLLRERPDVIVSTGAAPGYFALRLGRLLGARTLWLDSAANHEKLSMSGRKVGRFADLWLTQWPHLSTPTGPEYHGRVF